MYETITMSESAAAAMRAALSANRYVANRVITVEHNALDGITADIVNDWTVLCNDLVAYGYMVAVASKKDPTNSQRAYYKSKFDNALFTAARFIGLEASEMYISGAAYRVIAASYRVATTKSDALKDAERALKDAKTAYNEYKEELPENAYVSQLDKLDDLKIAVDKRQKDVNDLLNQPHNKEFTPRANLTADGMRANIKGRAIIENVFADILNETEYYSVEEIRAAAEDLKRKRKERAAERRREQRAAKAVEKAVDRHTENRAVNH